MQQIGVGLGVAGFQELAVGGDGLRFPSQLLQGLGSVEGGPGKVRVEFQDLIKVCQGLVGLLQMEVGQARDCGKPRGPGG